MSAQWHCSSYASPSIQQGSNLTGIQRELLSTICELTAPKAFSALWTVQSSHPATRKRSPGLLLDCSSFAPTSNLQARHVASNSKTDPESNNSYRQDPWSLSQHHLSPGVPWSTSLLSLHPVVWSSILWGTRVISCINQTPPLSCLKASEASQVIRPKHAAQPRNHTWSGPCLPSQPHLHLYSSHTPSSPTGLPSILLKSPSSSLEGSSTRSPSAAFLQVWPSPHMCRHPPLSCWHDSLPGQHAFPAWELEPVHKVM